MTKSNQSLPRRVLALDLGDRKSVLAFRRDGEIVRETLSTRRAAMAERLSSEPPSEVIFEAGSQSHWLAWELEDLGHQPVVVHPKSLPMNHKPSRKNDERDAELLLEHGEWRPSWMKIVKLRPRRQQLDLTCLRTRELLVKLRSQTALAVRGHAKLFGFPLPSGSPAALPKRARVGLPGDLAVMLQPLLLQIRLLTRALDRIDAQVDRFVEKYPETRVLMQVPGIGALTAVAFVLTLQCPERFEKSRDTGAAVGLVPRQRQSGDTDPELSITKHGDKELRRLMTLAAHRLTKEAAPDSDLKRFGAHLTDRGGKNAKKRAVVAVARKLTVLLTALWKSGEVYEPLREANRQAKRQAKRTAESAELATTSA
jgi:transposase